MSELNQISNSLSETLRDSDLQDVTVDLAETFSDSILEDGLLKDLPVIGMIVGLGRTAIKVQDRLFIKKLISFLSQLKQIPQEKRKKLIDKIDASEDYRIKVGEKLLYILDNCEDSEKAQLTGKLFKAFLMKIIDYDCFLRISRVIDRAMIDDLLWFIKNNWESLTIEDAADYLNWGIFEIAPLTIDLHESIDYDSATSHFQDPEKKYRLEGGELIANINFIGKMLRKALKE